MKLTNILYRPLKATPCVPLWAVIMVLLSEAAAYSQMPTSSVVITVHADRMRGELNPIWRFFGYDEPNYTYHPDGLKLLDEMAQLRPQPVYVRCHHLMTSGDGTPWLKWGSTNIYTEDAEGRPIYSWTIVDRIFDAYRQRGLRPYVQFGFMPKALSSQPEPYTPKRVDSGNPSGMVSGGAYYPPKDYRKWEMLVEAWVRHCVERYGRAEAENWYWELWNEPNIGYWKGTPEEFFRLYDHTAAALKRVLPNARIGGPETAGAGGSRNPGSGGFTRAFFDHCLRGTNAATGGIGAPLDFLVFHAKGNTTFADGQARMNLGAQLRVIDTFCSIAAEYPELKAKPVIIGESDPEGGAAFAARFFPQNAYRNGAQYASYTAAAFLRKQEIAERHGIRLEGAITWAFTFPNQPWFEGFRELATHGIPKAVFNAFRMFSRMEQQRLAVDNPHRIPLETLMAGSVRGAPDVDAAATRGERAITMLVWHYHDVGAPAPSIPVTVALDGLPAEAQGARLRHWRIDDEHSNPYTVWQAMG
ncbi:MAG: beta-xylosidase, partial [Candidatus Sumerlaeia bacterium]|nr:beta-xylosidase [Candidatus Sumerlaeia bacterium]